MSVSILVVDDEPDVAELFRQQFRREARQGTYVLHFAYSGEEALDKLPHTVRERTQPPGLLHSKIKINWLAAFRKTRRFSVFGDRTS